MSDAGQERISRRNFLKLAGLAGAAVQAGGLVAAGVAEGSSSETYTGWESFNPGTQFINRKPYEFEGPAYKPVGETRRASHLTDYVFGRVRAFEAAYNENPDWTLDDPIEELGVAPPLVEFYNTFPERLEWDYKTFSETIPTNREDRAKYGNHYILANAYGAGFGAYRRALPGPTEPPEVSDFQTGPDQPIGEPVPFKSPALASELIKEFAHRFGSTLVRITKVEFDFLYSEGWRGCPEDYDYSEKPEHWENAIVLGVPMEWDVVAASPHFSTSSDAYNRVSSAALRLEAAIKSLGYAARANTPDTGYDMVVPPHAIEAGLGQAGRFGYCLTPEVGGNIRTAIIATNMPLEIDKPIDFGVTEFCNKCKLCAEGCPSGAISFADSPEGMVIRGYEHWFINNGACYNFWRETMGPMGCRLCVMTCPYSRKDNWMHTMAKQIDANDPTGAVSSGLLFMQKNYFTYPDAEDYRRPPDGHFETFRPQPSYFDAEKYLDIDITAPPEA